MFKDVVLSLRDFPSWIQLYAPAASAWQSAFAAQGKCIMIPGEQSLDWLELETVDSSQVPNAD